jgi:mono/diheme cytochrome c family protein
MNVCVWLGAALVVATVPGASAPAAPRQAPAATDGRQLYATHCASCHGSGGRGDGPMAEHLRVPPADLVSIAARNKGAFPTAVIERIVDGRQALKLHGSAMPVWGDAFSLSGTPAADQVAAAKIRAIVAYLESIQKRPGE